MLQTLVYYNFKCLLAYSNSTNIYRYGKKAGDTEPRFYYPDSTPVSKKVSEDLIQEYLKDDVDLETALADDFNCVGLTSSDE